MFKEYKLFNMGTHIPVLKAILEAFEPTGILELGIGENSTRMFYQYNKPLISIETDAEWYQYMKDELISKDNFKLIHHKLPANIHRKSKLHRDISMDLANDCVEFYKDVIEQNSDVNFLFIDHVSGLRGIALASLFDRFDFVVYHDAENKGYGYDLFKSKDSDQYIKFMFKSFESWSGILINNDYADKIECFEAALYKYGSEYYNGLYNHVLKKF